MTKNELKAALDLAGVAYAKKANLETLMNLYAQHVASVATVTDHGTGFLDATDPTMPMGENGNSLVDVLPTEEAATPAPEAPEAATPAGTGLKIEKDRPEQNGVKRPSIGGKCRAIWDALDAYRAETGELPTSKTVKELAADEGWNPNNASIEYYQWRKFNGIAKGK